MYSEISYMDTRLQYFFRFRRKRTDYRASWTQTLIKYNLIIHVRFLSHDLVKCRLNKILSFLQKFSILLTLNLTHIVVPRSPYYFTLTHIISQLLLPHTTTTWPPSLRLVPYHQPPYSIPSLLIIIPSIDLGCSNLRKLPPFLFSRTAFHVTSLTSIIRLWQIHQYPVFIFSHRKVLLVHVTHCVYPIHTASITPK